MQGHPDTRLVVVDTFQKVRSVVGGKANAFGVDYADAGALKAFADKHGLCLLLVHHLRKMQDDSDPFNRISGTSGILGAADTALVMTRDKRSDAETLLSLRGVTWTNKSWFAASTRPPADGSARRCGERRRTKSATRIRGQPACQDDFEACPTAQPVGGQRQGHYGGLPHLVPSLPGGEFATGSKIH